MIEIKSRTGDVLHVVEAGSLVGADLRGAKLRGADLIGADLRGANLRGANLYGADLRGANLRGADLRGANLYRADLHGADLSGADLRGANLGDQWIIQGGTRADGYAFFLQKLTDDDAPMVKAGCRYMTIDDAREHWTETRGGTPLGDESLELIASLEKIAKLRGLI